MVLSSTMDLRVDMDSTMSFARDFYNVRVRRGRLNHDGLACGTKLDAMTLDTIL